MVLVQSSAEDISTTSVVQWLAHTHQPFVRLNDISIIKQVKYWEGDIIITTTDREINLKNIDAYWYRRGLLVAENTYLPTASPQFKKAFGDQQQDDNVTMVDTILTALQEKKISIGNARTDITVNKLVNLQKASLVGLQTPHSIITNQKEEVAVFKNKCGRIITKPINNAFSVSTRNYWHPSYTTELTDERMAALPDTFKSSLFQQLIEKKLDIRVFYLVGELYAMAIFSQNDEQTKIDFRNYNYDRPNRTVPFTLPAPLKQQLCNLMETLGYKTGSIDLVYTPEKAFYFLEVNPVGQFGMVSYPCNYYLERRIAQVLSNNKNETA